MSAEELDRMQQTALLEETQVGEDALALIDEVRRLQAALNEAHKKIKWLEYQMPGQSHQERRV